ncbi:MAG: hypothetical protein CL608_09240 [Anaerolineaceae bacterium]|nr:hypothetical protein [Anaerolineaceae bacterium]
MRRKFWVLVGLVLGIIGALVFIFAFDLIFAPIILTFLLLGSSLGGMFGLLFVLIRNEDKNLKYRPLIPIMGQLMRLEVRETIRGLISLDKSGTYHSSTRSRVEPGKIKIQFKLNSLDRDRVRKYREKYTKRIPIPLEFNAGFLTLNGRPNVRVHPSSKNLMSDWKSHAIVLHGNARKNAFLMGHQIDAVPDWLPVIDYTFQQLPTEVGRELPVQIIPRVVRQGSGWSLELLVQVTPGIGLMELSKARIKIEELSLYVTPMWGQPESASDSLFFTRANVNNPKSKLVWKDVKISGEDKQENGEFTESKEYFDKVNNPDVIKGKRKNLYLEEERGRRKFFVVRFEHSITPDTVGVPLTGRLKIRFDYALSGIKSLSYYYPTGKKHDLDRVKTDIITDVNVDFRLDLQSLCFQEPISPHMPALVSNVPPDHLTIRKLSDKLAEDGVYVQRIIENEPRTDKTSAKIINRYWRMEGRKYVGLYPIDFHIVITGRQEYAEVKISEEKVPDKGQTFFEVKIFAMVFNSEMRREVLNFAEQIKVIIEYVLIEPDFDKSDLSHTELDTNHQISEQSLSDQRKYPDSPSRRPSTDDHHGGIYGR